MRISTRFKREVPSSVTGQGPFLRSLKRGVHLYTLASGSQLEPVQVEIEEQIFEVPMGMTRYRDDPFDEARINVDEYQIFKLVTRHGVTP